MPVVDPGSSFLPRLAVQQRKKPVLAYELFLKDGGEAGIRTPETPFLYLTKSARVKIANGFGDFGLTIHHEGTVTHNWFINGFAR